MIEAVHEDADWDILACFDMSVCQTPRGRWYCDQCDGKGRGYYGTSMNLCVAHSFEPMFAWIEKNVQAGNALALFSYGDNDGCREALIRPKNDLSVRGGKPVEAYPLVASATLSDR